MDTIDNVRTILDAGKDLAAEVRDINGIPCIVTASTAIPLGPVLDMSDARADRPRRRKGNAILQAVDSFTAFVNRDKSAHSAIFADPSSRKFVAVLNYNPAGAGADAVAWNDHRAIYNCPLSTEWKAWGGGCEIGADQDKFAVFLIRREKDLAVGGGRSTDEPYPSPADLMTLASSLESYSHTNAKRERDARTGKTSVQFSEQSGIKGNVVIPAAFGIRIPIFEDSAPMLVEVGMRIEIRDNAAFFVIGIADADKILRTEFHALVQDVQTATSLPCFLGTPET